jgi:hypothetical protein
MGLITPVTAGIDHVEQLGQVRVSVGHWVVLLG